LGVEIGIQIVLIEPLKFKITQAFKQLKISWNPLRFL